MKPIWKRLSGKTSLAVLAVTFATLVTAFIYAGFDAPLFVRVFKTAGLWMTNVAVLSLAISWVSSRLFFDKLPRLAFFGIHLALAFVFAGLWTVLAFLDLKIYADPLIVRYLNNMTQQYFHIGIFVYAAVAGWMYTLQYHQRTKEQAVREVELLRLAREAELKALKAQINPHFLFNTLNTVNAMANDDPEGARTTNARLANVIRYSLDGSERDFVALEEELDFVRDYLGIEKTRLGERLQVELEIDDSAMRTRIPPMTLQPLVENAIKHGVAPESEGGIVRVAVTASNGILTFRVRDSGPGVGLLPEDTLLRRGVGLRNVKERMHRIYDDAFSLHIHGDESTGCTVSLSFPADRTEP